MPETFQAIYMDKGELLEAISSKTTTTKKQTETILTAQADTIIDVSSSSEKVTPVGFDSFAAREHKTKSRNLRIGKKIKIPAAKALIFSAIKVFKE